MYQLHRSIIFEKYEQFTFTHSKSCNSFSIIPEWGAHLREVIINGQSIIDGYASKEELEANYYGKSDFLAPFPNRIKEGKYIFEGKTYQFPINHPPNAIHGFVRKKPFEVQITKTTLKSAQIILRHTYKGESSAFPFPFELEVSFTMKEANGFEMSMQIKNTGTCNMPAGLGWHPYFRIAPKVDMVQLQAPNLQLVDLDQYLIPTGTYSAYSDFKTLSPIGSKTPDNCFLLENNGKKEHVTLKSALGTLNYWQETGRNKYNYLILFVPPFRTSIAIEPMTCSTDAFNNGNGLVVLKPQQRLGGKFGFSFTLSTSDTVGSQQSQSGVVGELGRLTDGLYWMSESDYPFEIKSFDSQEVFEDFLALQSEPASMVEHIEPYSFFQSATQNQTWHTAQDTAIVEQYRALVKFLKANLQNVACYRFGDTLKEVYIVGETKSCEVVLLATKVVET
jgi:aldose 1-epimerase